MRMETERHAVIIRGDRQNRREKGKTFQALWRKSSDKEQKCEVRCIEWFCCVYQLSHILSPKPFFSSQLRSTLYIVLKRHNGQILKTINSFIFLADFASSVQSCVVPFFFMAFLSLASFPSFSRSLCVLRELLLQAFASSNEIPTDFSCYGFLTRPKRIAPALVLSVPKGGSPPSEILKLPYTHDFPVNPFKLSRDSQNFFTPCITIFISFLFFFLFLSHEQYRKL